MSAQRAQFISALGIPNFNFAWRPLDPGVPRARLHAIASGDTLAIGTKRYAPGFVLMPCQLGDFMPVRKIVNRNVLPIGAGNASQVRTKCCRSNANYTRLFIDLGKRKGCGLLLGLS